MNERTRDGRQPAPASGPCRSAPGDRRFGMRLCCGAGCDLAGVHAPGAPQGRRTDAVLDDAALCCSVLLCASRR